MRDEKSESDQKKKKYKETELLSDDPETAVGFRLSPSGRTSDKSYWQAINGNANDLVDDSWLVQLESDLARLKKKPDVITDFC